MTISSYRVHRRVTRLSSLLFLASISSFFASGRMKGRQPLWPEAIERNIRPAAERAKITKRISWHVFRHTFSTLLAENDEGCEDRAIADAPRQQQHHHEHLHPRGQQQKAAGAEQSCGNDSDARKNGTGRSGCRLMCIFLCIAPIFQKWTYSFGMNGGDDETRTRDLCRDSAA